MTDGRIGYATPSAAAIFGDVAVEDSRLEDLVDPDTRADVVRVMDMILAGITDGAHGFLLRIERLDGRDAVLEIRSSDLRADRTVGGVVLTLRDVTEQHQLEQELKHQAYHDSLTGLPNRVLFADRAADAIDHAHRTERIVGMLFVDLDDFKVVNDTMGHGSGDELLTAVAGRLSASVRPSDTAARLGGDEFALLIDDAPDTEAVEAFAERIVAAFAEPFRLGDAEVIATATVGVATSADSADAGELLRHADLALYAAKTAGKRQWRRYQPALSAGMLRRREVQAALEEAVQQLGVHPRLPADRGARQRPDRRLRGAHPVAPPAVGDDAARPVHHAGGGDRPHRPARRVGGQAGPLRHGPVAPPDGGAR